MKAAAVVAGGGFAALEIALALHERRRDMALAVVTTETEVTYRPWLIKLPASGAQPPAIPLARLLTAAGVDLISDAAASVEYAAWLAARGRGVAVTAIDGDGTLESRFGDQATARIRAILERRGGRLISNRPLQGIGEGSVELQGGAVAADVVALAAPLRGGSRWLPQALLDERGMLRVDSSMAAAAGVFGIGDVVAVPEGYGLRPTLMSIRATAGPIAANLVRALEDVALKPVLRPNKPDMIAPDLAGEALLVRNRQLVMSGRLPLLLRSIGERRYLRLRRAHSVPKQPSLSEKPDPVS